MTKRGLLSFRHAEMFSYTKGKFRNTKRSSGFILFCFVLTMTKRGLLSLDTLKCFYTQKKSLETQSETECF